MSCSPTPLPKWPKTQKTPLHAFGRSITIAWPKTAPHLDSSSSLYLYLKPRPEIRRSPPSQTLEIVPVPRRTKIPPPDFVRPAVRCHVAPRDSSARAPTSPRIPAGPRAQPGPPRARSCPVAAALVAPPASSPPTPRDPSAVLLLSGAAAANAGCPELLRPAACSPEAGELPPPPRRSTSPPRKPAPPRPPPPSNSAHHRPSSRPARRRARIHLGKRAIQI